MTTIDPRKATPIEETSYQREKLNEVEQKTAQFLNSRTSFGAGGAGPQGVAETRKILNNVNRLFTNMSQATNPVSHNYDPVFEQSLTTKPLDGGALQRGSFAVFPIPVNGKTRYEIANMSTQSKILGDIHLSETADAIVKLLNKQYSFYSPEVKRILEAEQMYVKHYNDAISFKRQSAGGTMNSVLETRFNEAKKKAIQIKETIKDLNSKL